MFAAGLFAASQTKKRKAIFSRFSMLSGGINAELLVQAAAMRRRGASNGAKLCEMGAGCVWAG